MNATRSEWEEREDAFGPATEVRELIEVFCQTPDAILLESIVDRVCHQGTRFSAAPLVGARILELVRSKADHLPMVAPSMVRIAQGDYVAKFPHFLSNEHLDWATSDGVALECDAIGREFAELAMAQLRDADMCIRIAAAFASFWYFGGDPRYLESMRSCAFEASSTAERFSVAIACSLASIPTTRVQSIDSWSHLETLLDVISNNCSAIEAIDFNFPEIGIPVSRVPWFDGRPDLPIMLARARAGGGLSGSLKGLLDARQKDPFHVQLLLQAALKLVNHGMVGPSEATTLREVIAGVSEGTYTFIEREQLRIVLGQMIA